MGIYIHKTGDGPSELGHIGTVVDVIRAVLPEEVTSKRYNANDFKMAFEMATPKSIQSLGESVIVNGYCYATSTDAASLDYGRTISGQEFTTGGIFIVPLDALPAYQVKIHGKKAMIDFYNELYGKVLYPLAFGGIFHFSAFHGVAIGKAPIDGKDIFLHKSSYYPFPEVRAENVYGFVIGAMTNFQGHEKVNEELKTVLYKNPMDTSSLLVHHAHVLLLKKKVEKIEEIIPSIVDQTLHLFIEGTEIISGKVEIYTISGVKNCIQK